MCESVLDAVRKAADPKAEMKEVESIFRQCFYKHDKRISS